ncbi:hypothetical protein [uncultured Draconibacterium sp.]|uniref:hypothetical protein n=1 Tax=uncultured Draconibacterium sp. TaxID=1573823 RepID=UPI0025DE9D1A|nr:hypothetical protein [uncultured Draconibacterium sp.]
MENTANCGTHLMRIVHRNPKNQPIGGFSNPSKHNSDNLDKHIDCLQTFVCRVADLAKGTNHTSPEEIAYYGHLCLEHIIMLGSNSSFRRHFNNVSSR